MNTTSVQQAKQTVREFNAAFDAAPDTELAAVLTAHSSDDYFWRGMHPFYEQTGAAAVAEVFWAPLRHSFTSLQRREDVFMAGSNFVDDGATIWVVSMGNLMGLFDQDWLGIPATRKMAFLRYAEFHRVENGKIAESAFFCDVLSIMHQAGCYPLPPPTGANIIQPGPRTHDGLMFEAQPPEEGEKTLSADDRCPPEILQKTWHDDMIWYGPTGIGATYTIPRYQEQHQYPFRTQLKDKVFNGHIARVAEGNYLGFFGWANNWVFIDLLHWLSMQGLDVLARLRENS
jgi:ketosteroid isomerase-like protein